MPRLEWNRELDLGHPQIDDQHQTLIQLANDLIAAVAAGKKGKYLETFIKKLREYTVYHFNAEEALMEEVHYKQRIEHLNAHNQLKQTVKEFQEILYHKEDLTATQVLAFMKEWLLDHILTHDRDLARFIQQQNMPVPDPEQESGQEPEQEPEPQEQP